MTRPPPPDLRARILAEARREPSPTRAARSQSVLVMAAAGTFASLAVFARFGLASARPAAVLLAIGIGGGVAAFSSMWLAASRGRSMLGRSRASLIALAVLAPLFILASAMQGASLQGSLGLAGGTVQQHLVCFALTMLFALGPFAAVVYARRGTDPVHPRALGAALGAAAGVCGGALIDLHCTLTTVEHFALGHVLPIALLAAIGALLGGRVLGIRASAAPR